MAQVAATVFLVAIILGVAKMAWDVQVGKIKRILNMVKDYMSEYEQSTFYKPT